MRRGSCSSPVTYSIPRLQLFPSVLMTVSPSTVTTKAQPLGHVMQISFLCSCVISVSLSPDDSHAQLGRALHRVVGRLWKVDIDHLARAHVEFRLSGHAFFTIHDFNPDGFLDRQCHSHL